MGEVRVQLEVADAVAARMARRGLIAEHEVSRLTVEAVVDTGATSSVIPEWVAERLGVATDRTEAVILADGQTYTVPVTDLVEFRAMGRVAVEECLVIGAEVLVGQFFLELTDLFVDSRNRRLVGNPDHPDRKVHKVRTLIPAE